MLCIVNQVIINANTSLVFNSITFVLYLVDIPILGEEYESSVTAKMY